ncbi:MAG: MFS transporter [Candidatus Methylacidiphilales bacterium]|nr:MFS transporter [Candidatus Methylacidiphilales bacterium]
MPPFTDFRPPSTDRNITLFVMFRLLFSARFYYPVLAILFLDYGLTLEQFAILNTLWAAAIVAFEVPSGALADRWGRKRMVCLASWLMVLEMGVLVFVPLGNPWIVFAAFALNRILSGAAEACASGADEALAYDSLKAEGREAEWPAVLRNLMRWQSVAFVFAMLLGAAVYDPDLGNRAAGWFGLDPGWTKAHTLRLPVALTLGSALVACLVTARMIEPPGAPAQAPSVRAVWLQILAAGRWILGQPLIVAVLLAGLLHDSFIRLILTLESEYLRVTGWPVAWLGIIAAASGALGLAVSPLASLMDRRPGLVWKFALTTFLTTMGLAGMVWLTNRWSLGFVLLLQTTFGLVAYFLSQAINARVDSAQRATVLSFKGLSFNLGYGLIGLAYGAAHQSQGAQADFVDSLRWLPWAFAALMAVLALACWAQQKKRDRPV